jgi:hypothetical protein
MNEIEALDAETWFRTIEKLSRRLAQAEDGYLLPSLRQAFHLVQLTPRPLRCAISCNLGELAFEALLEAQATESAAQALVGPAMIYTLSAQSSGEFEATVTLAKTERLTPVRADSAAAALLVAWTNYLLGLKAQSLNLAKGSQSPTRRRVQFAPHPTSM